MEGRPPEHELVLRSQNGDARAFEQLVEPHREVMFRVAYLIVRNAADAEDAAQDALVKAWRALGRFRRDAPVASALHAQGGIVSLLFLHHGSPILLSEIGSNSHLLKKIAITSTSIRWQRVGNDPALWIAGDGHVVVFPHAAPRLAGHVLVWEHGDLTLRLEGAHLSLRDALTLAADID